MKKKDIKELFQAIRKSELQKVQSMVEADPGFISVTNFAPPKMDDGQSPLQVAFKTGNFDIARYLLSKGAEVNFKETSAVNEWTAPVLHDCIRAVIFNTHTLQKDHVRFEHGLGLLQLMLQKGADPNAADSYGNSGLHRAILDTRQMIDNPGAELDNGILLQQLRLVFKALVDAGANLYASTSTRSAPADDIVQFRLAQYLLV